METPQTIERPWLEGRNWRHQLDNMPFAADYFDFHLLPEIERMARDGWRKGMARSYHKNSEFGNVVYCESYDIFAVNGEWV